MRAGNKHADSEIWQRVLHKFLIHPPPVKTSTQANIIRGKANVILAKRKFEREQKLEEGGGVRRWNPDIFALGRELLLRRLG